MRTRLKLLCSLFAAIFVFSAMSMAVVADVQLVQSGTSTSYDWYYYSNNEFLIKSRIESLNLSYISDFDYFENVKTVTCDFTELGSSAYSQSGYYIDIVGANIPATNINIIDDGTHNILGINIDDFHNLSSGKSITFSESFKPQSIGINRCNVDTVDSINNLDHSCLSGIVFNVCNSLTDISYSCNSLTLFDCNSLKNISFTGQLLRLSSCSSAETISIAGDNNELHISDCDSLTSVSVSDSSNDLVIGYCDNLTSVNISGSVEHAYIYECDALTSLDTGLSTTDFEIADCKLLSDVTLHDGIESFSLYGCPNITGLDIPDSVSDLSLQLVGINELSDLNVENLILRGDSFEKVTLASGVSAIGDKAFYQCGNLSEVSIPNTVTSIGSSAFRCCYSLKSIDLPDSITTISPLAFGYSGLESVEFPSGLTFIEYYSFVNCKSLKSVTIPTSVTCIDKEAFYGCSKLTDVYYEGTEEEWNQIEVDPDDITLEEALNNATIHFGSSQPVQQSGWVQDGNKWLYYDDNGSKVTGWKQIDGTWYDFDSNGIMLTGWQESGSDWYYMNGSGAMVTGWIQSSGKWYFMDKSSGAMKTGWLNDGGTWYYFNGSGAMVTGWVEISGKWYYFESSGAMKTGWIQSSGDWYCLKSDGSMAAGEYVRGYWLNANGKWTYKPVAKWVKDSVGWYYIDTNGWYVKSDSVMIDGKVYDFDSRGYCTNP